MGQCLALALASSPGLARKAAALVVIDYDELVPVSDARAAAAARAPSSFPRAR